MTRTGLFALSRSTTLARFSTHLQSPDLASIRISASK